jgi:hypothetical protein
MSRIVSGVWKTVHKDLSNEYMNVKNIRFPAVRLQFTAVIPAFERLTQENHEFKASLGYITKLCLENKKG